MKSSFVLALATFGAGAFALALPFSSSNIGFEGGDGPVLAPLAASADHVGRCLAPNAKAIELETQLVADAQDLGAPAFTSGTTTVGNGVIQAQRKDLKRVDLDGSVRARPPDRQQVGTVGSIDAQSPFWQRVDVTGSIGARQPRGTKVDVNGSIGAQTNLWQQMDVTGSIGARQKRGTKVDVSGSIGAQSNLWQQVDVTGSIGARQKRGTKVDVSGSIGAQSNLWQQVDVTGSIGARQKRGTKVDVSGSMGTGVLNWVDCEPQVIYDLSGSTLLGYSRLHFSAYSDGTATLAEIDPTVDEPRIELRFFDRAVVKGLMDDLAAAGAMTLYDTTVQVQDVPMATLTCFEESDAGTSKARTFSYYPDLSGGPWDGVERVLQKFIRWNFPRSITAR